MRLRLSCVIALVLTVAPAEARQLVSHVSEADRIVSIKPDYPVPREPDQLFYVQRSVNANTVVYVAREDGKGHFDGASPVEAYWRWFNDDGHKKPLNFVERMLAYGVHGVARDPVHAAKFTIAALPERTLFLDHDAAGHPEALIAMGNHLARLVYVYLDVDDTGMVPKVLGIDIFGVDRASGKALREHIVNS